MGAESRGCSRGVWFAFGDVASTDGGYEDKRGLENKSAESAESAERLDNLGAMKVECARRCLCVWCSWGNHL